MTRFVFLKEKKRPTLPTSVDSAFCDLVASECVRCGICTQECSFLSQQGTPGEIAATLHYSTGAELPFSCSLCGLCTHYCPKKLPVSQMFLEQREKAVAREPGLLKRYRVLQRYEWLGGSALFGGEYLPTGCNTVFFPGCSLPGIRPEGTIRLFKALKEVLPNLGMVLDCCGKISANLGDRKTSDEKKLQLLGYLHEMGVKRIITTCPSCLQHFRQHGDGMDVSLAYSELLNGDVDSSGRAIGLDYNEYTIHDPCTLRFDGDVQQAVRKVLADSGTVFSEMAHSGESGLCCGEGGATAFLDVASKLQWQQKRVREIKGRTVVTYCAGCEINLAPLGSVHILDLLFPTEAGKKEKTGSRIHFYLNRLIFKVKIAYSHFTKRFLPS